MLWETGYVHVQGEWCMVYRAMVYLGREWGPFTLQPTPIKATWVFFTFFFRNKTWKYRGGYEWLSCGIGKLYSGKILYVVGMWTTRNVCLFGSKVQQRWTSYEHYVILANGEHAFFHEIVQRVQPSCVSVHHALLAFQPIISQPCNFKINTFQDFVLTYFKQEQKCTVNYPFFKLSRWQTRPKITIECSHKQQWRHFCSKKNTKIERWFLLCYTWEEF
jgi:hypothetical protein